MTSGGPSAEELYRSLVENLPASVVILFDQQLRFLLVDGPEVAATGFSKQAVEGKTLHEALPTNFAAAVEPNMRRVLAGERFSADVPFDDRHYHYEYVPIRADDEVRYGLIVGQNITDRVRAEQERRQLEARLQQAGKLDALGRLAGGVAHDFNNLLTAIQAYTSLLLGNAALDERARTDLTEIQRATERAASLTKQLLAFSRKHVSEPTLVDVDEALSSALRMLERLLGEDVEVVFEPGASKAVVRLDSGAVEQVLVNLAVNARDAMPSGGRLTIATSRVKLDEDFCSRRVGASPGWHVRLRVTDTGGGMSPDLVQHVFEPFFTTKGLGVGTGLGLSIVYGIVRGAGGFIDVTSEPKQGTTFDVFFPAHEGEAAPGLSEPARPSRRRLNVLLVEDEPALLAVTARVLRDAGHEVRTAALPEQALEIAADPAAAIDLLITDVIMPSLNGRELHERVCQRRPGLPVVFLSGYTDAVIADRLGAGGVQFVQKPFAPATLLAKIDEATAALGAKLEGRA